MCWQRILCNNCVHSLTFSNFETCAPFVGRDFPVYAFIMQPCKMCMNRDTNKSTTFNNGSLGSRIDEERSELRYVM